MDSDQYRRETREHGVIMCVIVGDVPNSGYMLRFTQEHACVRIKTKPVDMPEDSPQTPQATKYLWIRYYCILYVTIGCGELVW